MIILVDDCQDIRDSLGELLIYEGYSVTLASDGEAALNILEYLVPSIIFLDLRMPVLNGWQFRQIQNNDIRIKHIPTVICSGESDLENKIKLFPNELFLSKPFDINRLFAILNQYCKRN